MASHCKNVWWNLCSKILDDFYLFLNILCNLHNPYVRAKNINRRKPMELGITSAINLKGLASRVSSKDISSRYDIGKSMLMKYMLINDDALSDIYIYIYITFLCLLVYCTDKDHLILLQISRFNMDKLYMWRYRQHAYQAYTKSMK